MFIKGLILGLSIAAPVGPIGVICIRRSLNESRLSGIVSGLGAASADAFYASIAAFGLTYLSNILTSQQHLARFAGGIFLFFLGIRTFLRKSNFSSLSPIKKKNLTSNFFTTFLLTLSNPITVISFTAIFSGAGLLNSTVSTGSPFFLVLGVFLGSTLWWVFLSSIVGTLRFKISPSHIIWINRISGSIIIGFGIFSLISLF